MTVTFTGRNSSCVLVYNTCSSYYISIFAPVVNNVQLMEVCSDGGKIRLTVETREKADELAEQLKNAIDNNTDANFEVLEVCL